MYVDIYVICVCTPACVHMHIYINNLIHCAFSPGEFITDTHCLLINKYSFHFLHCSTLF